MTNMMMKFIAILVLMISTVASAATKIAEIEFTDTRLNDVVRTLSELSNANIIATPKAINQRITVHLKNVNELDAIKSICRISDLWYRYDVDTNTYRIMTREEYARDLVVRESQQIKVFHLRNANVRIVAQAIEDLYGDRVELSLGVEAGLSGNQRGGNLGGSGRSNIEKTDTEKLSLGQLEQLAGGGNQTNILAVDANQIQQVTLKAQPIYVTVNNEHNMIIARTDDDKVISSIKSLVKQMDIPVPQVMLEMKILSISLGDDFNSIFNFQLAPKGKNQSLSPIEFGNTALRGTGTFLYEFLDDRLRANIEFLEENNRLKVLSNPMVLASNHREADLFIGEESLLTRGFTYNAATIDNGVVISPAFIVAQTELRDVGISLTITPRINSDGSVLLELEQESSTLNPGGATLPIQTGEGSVSNLSIDTINTARLKGTVAAQNGLTVAVGGLIRSSTSTSERKVPLLGDVPIVGAAFRSTIESDEETEMVLLITPRILNAPDSSKHLQRVNNRFYQQYNDGFPEPEAPEPRFFKEQNKKPASKPNSSTGNQNSWGSFDDDMMDAG